MFCNHSVYSAGFCPKVFGSLMISSCKWCSNAKRVSTQNSGIRSHASSFEHEKASIQEMILWLFVSARFLNSVLSFVLTPMSLNKTTARVWKALPSEFSSSCQYFSQPSFGRTFKLSSLRTAAKTFFEDAHLNLFFTIFGFSALKSVW